MSYVRSIYALCLLGKCVNNNAELHAHIYATFKLGAIQKLVIINIYILHSGVNPTPLKIFEFRNPVPYSDPLHPLTMRNPVTAHPEN